MKYLVPCVLVLPLITSCVEQDPYYEQNYYAPSARVEVHQDDYPNRHYHNHHGYHRPAAPQGRTYHGHTDLNQNKIIIQSTPQAHVQVQQNVHVQQGNNDNEVKKRAAAKKLFTSRQMRGSDKHNGNKPQQSEQESGAQTTHGHN